VALVHDLEFCELFDETHISIIFGEVWKRIHSERTHDGCSYSLIRMSVFELNLYIKEAAMGLIEKSANSILSNTAAYTYVNVAARPALSLIGRAVLSTIGSSWSVHPALGYGGKDTDHDHSTR
jgi:hypothetical protein